MKNIKIYLTLLLFVFLGISCFKDDSNYDFGTRVYDDASITMDAIPTFTLGDPVIVRPKEFKSGPYAYQEIDSTKFRWEYYAPNFSEDPTVPICTTMTFKRDLSKEGAVVNTSYSMLLRAIDDYGNVYDCTFSVKYGPKIPYSSRWAILAEGNNRESIMHLITGTDTSNFKVYNNCAKLVGSPSLGTGPQRIWYADNGMGHVGLVQESSKMEIISVYTFATYRSLSQLFQGGVVPAGVNPVYDMTIQGAVSLLWNNDGKLYTKIHIPNTSSNANNALNTKFTEKTLKHDDGSEVNCGFIITKEENPRQRKDVIIYDKTKNGFFLVCGKDLKNAGKVVPIYAPTSNANLAEPLPEPYNLSGYEVIYAESQGYAINTHYAFLRKDGKLYYYCITFATDSYYSPKVARATKLVMNEITDFPDEFPTDPKLYDIQPAGTYLFFVPKSDKKSIYYYDMNTNKVRVYMRFEGGEDITRIHCDYMSTATKATKLGVAKGNKFYILNAASGYLHQDVLFEDKIIGEFEFDEKVVDFFYR